MIKDYKDIQKEVFSEKFKEFCEKNVVKDLSKLEKYRKNCLLKIAFIYFLGVVAVFFIIKNWNSTCIVWMWLTGIISISVPYCICDTFKNKAKKIFLPKLISYVGNLYVAEKDNPIRYELEDHVLGLGIIPKFNRFYCDDYFAGNYKGVDFSVSELFLSYVYKSGKHSSERTIFEGLLISFKSFKKFKKNVMIASNSEECTHIKEKKPGYKKVNLEDPEFEKLFDVYSADQIEARYLLTPSFMNRMVELSKMPFSKKISASFENGTVNIFIHTKKNFFETSITKSMTNIANYRAVVLELLYLFSIVDTLKIDQNIGM